MNRFKQVTGDQMRTPPPERFSIVCAFRLNVLNALIVPTASIAW